LYIILLRAVWCWLLPAVHQLLYDQLLLNHLLLQLTAVRQQQGVSATVARHAMATCKTRCILSTTLRFFTDAQLWAEAMYGA
jgi:hypothetical protein